MFNNVSTASIIDIGVLVM